MAETNIPQNSGNTSNMEMVSINAVTGGNFEKAEDWAGRVVAILGAATIQTQFGMRTRFTLRDLDNGKEASILLSVTEVRDLIVDFFAKGKKGPIGPVVMRMGTTKGGDTWIFYNADADPGNGNAPDNRETTSDQIPF